MDGINKRILELRNIDDRQFKELSEKVSTTSTQIKVQKSIHEILRLVEKNQALPVRRIVFNIKKLCDGSEQSRSRWETLQSLDFNSLVLCTLSFPGLVSLSPVDFNWLVDNTEDYLQAQRFSSNLAEIDQIKKVIANIQLQENTKGFLESKCFSVLKNASDLNHYADYHKFMLQTCNKFI